MVDDLAAAGDEAKDRMFVTALARGLDVLRCFGPDDQYLGNQDIARRTGLPKPTVCRMTHTLTRLGYLRFNGRLEKYQLGAGVLSLGYAALATMNIRDIVRPYLQSLADMTNASVSMGMRDRLSMVYVATCRGRGPVTLRLDVGSRLPLATTSMGKAYLAVVPEDERLRLLDELAVQNGELWPRMKAGIDQALEDYRSLGFTLATGEWQREIHAVGRAFVLPDGETVMALNCGAASYMMPADKLKTEFGPRLVETVSAIEAALARP